jgi:squalene synthase HpnC
VPWCFDDELRRYGPDAPERRPPIGLDDANAYCAGVAASHYENFHVVTRLTPRPLRPAFAAIYAYCRWSDDLGDEAGSPERARTLLRWWKGELQGLFEQDRATHPVFVALRPVVTEFGIPIGPFGALLSAFEQDQDVPVYDTYERLLDYCTRSANPVGHLVLYLFRAFDPENARDSDATCTALQLTNFWQDVVPDLTDRGRIYLPAEDMARFGVTRADLEARRVTDGFRRLMAFEVERARALFDAGRPLIGRVPRAVAVDVDLFTRGGLAILERIERQGYDVLSRRPSIGKLAKAGLLARAVWGHLNPWTGRPGAAVDRVWQEQA